MSLTQIFAALLGTAALLSVPYFERTGPEIPEGRVRTVQHFFSFAGAALIAFAFH